MDNEIQDWEMDMLAKNIQSFVDCYTNKYIIPPNLRHREAEISSALSRIDKFERKLKKHNVDAAFTDAPEYDELYD